MRDTIEPRTQYDNWRERHAEALRRLQSEQAARVAAAEQDRARSEELCRQAVGESMRRVAQMQEQEQEQDVVRVQYILDESSSNLNWLQKERDREDRELSGVELRTAQEVNNTGDMLEAARRNEASISQQLDSQSTKYVSDRLKLLKELDELRQRSVLEEAESNSTIQQTTKEFSY